MGDHDPALGCRPSGHRAAPARRLEAGPRLRLLTARAMLRDGVDPAEVAASTKVPSALVELIRAELDGC